MEKQVTRSTLEAACGVVRRSWSAWLIRRTSEALDPRRSWPGSLALRKEVGSCYLDDHSRVADVGLAIGAGLGWLQAAEELVRFGRKCRIAISEPPWSVPQSPPQLFQTGSLTKRERRGRELCPPLTSLLSWAKGGALTLPGWTSNSNGLGSGFSGAQGQVCRAPQVPEWSCILTGFLTGEHLGLEDLKHSCRLQRRCRLSSHRVGLSSECRWTAWTDGSPAFAFHPIGGRRLYPFSSAPSARAAEAEGRMQDNWGAFHDIVSSSWTSGKKGDWLNGATREKTLVQPAARWLLRWRPFEPELIDSLCHDADELLIRKAVIHFAVTRTERDHVARSRGGTLIMLSEEDGRMLSLYGVTARHTGIEQTWPRLRLRKGRSRSLKRKLSASAERQDWTQWEQSAPAERSISVGFPQAWHTLSLSVISVQGSPAHLTMTA